MTETRIVDIIRAVPLDRLTKDGMPEDLRVTAAELIASGMTVADIATIVDENGYRLVIAPTGSVEEPDDMETEDEDEESTEIEIEVEAPGVSVEIEIEVGEDDDEEEDDDRGGLLGLLDRLRTVFGKAISFESENATISRNRKRAAARQPHEFTAAVWATRKGVVRCRVCGGPAPENGVDCPGVAMSKDAMADYGAEPMEHEHEDNLGDLTLRSAALSEAYDLIVDALGCFRQSDAHYMEQSPFVDSGLACLNCVAYCPEVGGCYWVEGSIAPEGVCKLWVIPERLQIVETVSKEIVEVDGRFRVTSADGSRSFGTYATRAEAEARLAEVERFSKADTYSPPAGVRAEAKRAEAWIADGHAGSGFTATGRRRAADLAAGNGVSLDTIQRIASYLARHEADKSGEGWSPGEPGYPSPGRVAWAAWGGDPAISWTRGILDGIEKDGPTVSDVHVDVPMGSGGRQKKKPPAIPSVFAKAEDRRFTLGPWYVPDSYDAHGEWTDSTELQSALWDYVRKGDRQIRLQHNVDVVAGEWVEALTWPYAVSVPMLDAGTGLTVEQEFPPGTVFMGVVWESWAWDLVKAGKIRGYSMGGAGQRVTVDLPSEGSV